MSKEKSYRQILRSTSIIGGASIINVLTGLLRIKVAAVLLGPTGVGLIGLFNNLVAAASTIAALGINTVGTKQIAEAVSQNNNRNLLVTRRALFWGGVALAVAGTSIFWLLRDLIAVHILKDRSKNGSLGWLALGVGLTVLSVSQQSLLNGLRKINHLALVTIYTAIISTLVSVTALLIWNEAGLLAFVLIVPASRYIIGYYFVAKVNLVNFKISFKEVNDNFICMARMGAAFMVAGLAASISQLLVRSLVQRELGIEALGHFEASWLISMTYVGFVLGAMGTDFYPRLTLAINDHESANRLINEQTEVALLLAAPVFLAMLGLAPWIIELLYSKQFENAVQVLRWQILGDILKLISWPLGFVLLATGDGRKFIISEFFAASIFVLCVWLGLSYLGLISTGIGFLIMYLSYLPVVYWIAFKKTGFKWTKIVKYQIGTVILLCIIIVTCAQINLVFAASLSVLCSLSMGLYAIVHFSHLEMQKMAFLEKIKALLERIRF